MNNSSYQKFFQNPQDNILKQLNNENETKKKINSLESSEKIRKRIKLNVEDTQFNKKANALMKTLINTSSLNSKLLLNEHHESKKDSGILKFNFRTDNSFTSLKESTRNNKGIFWDKKKVNDMRNKLRQIKKKVKKKSNEEKKFIISAIKTNQDDVVLQRLKQPTFKQFYRNKNELFKPEVFIEPLIENLKFSLLTELIQDPCYPFNKDYIFQFIMKTINIISKDNQSKSNIDQDSESEDCKYDNESNSSYLNVKNIKLIIKGLITYSLFPCESEEKTKIIGWFLAYFEFYSLFRHLINSCNFYDNIKNEYNFSSDKSIKKYGNNLQNFNQIIEFCLKCKFEKLAVTFCENNNNWDVGNLSMVAADTNNMIFLKYLWEKKFQTDFTKLPYKIKLDSHIKKKNVQKINLTNKDIEKNISTNLTLNDNSFTQNFDLTPVIRSIIKKGKATNGQNSKTEMNNNLNKLIKWKNVLKVPSLIQTLFQYHCFEQISEIITELPPEIKLKSDYFKTAIIQKETELILYFLKKNEFHRVLSDPLIQDFIVKEYIKAGETIYYGAEMLIYVYKNQWQNDLTKKLCSNIMRTLKTKDILNCHSPILTCLLLYEFLEKIKEISFLNWSRCQKLENELIEFCKSIQISNTSESYIQYLMKQKDTQGRDCFQIVSDKNLYTLLETPEIGTIVKKMWDGILSNNGLLIASSMHRFIFDQVQKPYDPFKIFDIRDDNPKVFIFQLAVWLDSCSLRLKPEGFIAVIKVSIFNILIYLLNNENQLLNSIKEMNIKLRVLIYIYLFLVTAKVLAYFIRIIYTIKTKKNLHFNKYNFIDLLLFVFSLLILLDPNEASRMFYKKLSLNQAIKNYLSNIGIPILKALNTETDKYILSFSFFFRAIILAMNDLLVWISVCDTLLTYKSLGPVIRMILAMAFLLVRYLLVIICFLIAFATFFTALFNRYSGQFITISESVITLFGGFLNCFELNKFSGEYLSLGSIIFIIYVCIAGVLIVNLLIAELSNVYEKLSTVVDASHRAVLIQKCKEYKLDEVYGYLIFLCSPFNLVNFLVIPFISIFNFDKKKLNIILIRIYYVCFYLPFIMVPYIVISIFYIPLAYLKGIILMIKYQNKIKVSKQNKLLAIFKWIGFGLVFCLFIYFKDIINCFLIIFREVEAKMSDLQRIKKNITNEDVIIFLKFIHSNIKKEDQKDLHSLFLVYGDFEKKERAQMDADLEKELDLSENKIFDNKLTLYKKNNLKNKQFSKEYTNKMKKNLMIIEIFENFITEDEYGESIVDIEKMRKLLPRTIKVENHHLRRLIHSNVHVLFEAMMNLKLTKNNFIQYKLVNKIIASAQKLDKDIDSEIFRLQMMKNTESKDNNNEDTYQIDKKKTEYKKSNKNIRKRNCCETQRINNSENDSTINDKKNNLKLMKNYEKIITNLKKSFSFLE